MTVKISRKVLLNEGRVQNVHRDPVVSVNFRGIVREYDLERLNEEMGADPLSRRKETIVPKYYTGPWEGSTSIRSFRGIKF